MQIQNLFVAFKRVPLWYNHWVNSSIISGRSPPLYCTLTLITRQGHHKNSENKNIVVHLLRMASVARVDRRLRRYYLIVRLLPNVFALAYRSLGSIYYDTGSPPDGKTPFGWLHPCRLVTDSRRYLIVGASAAMPLYSSFIFSLNNRASTIS